MAAAFAVLLVRLIVLHLGGEVEARDRVERNREVRRSIPAERGRVTDRNGRDNLLAVDLSMRDVGLDPVKALAIGVTQNVASCLSPLLGMPADEILARARETDGRYVLIKRSVPEEQAAAIQSLKLPGVVLNEVSVRFYPQRELLCHALGFVNRAGIGGAGIELLLDSHLRGSPGYVESRVNALRQELDRDLFIPPLRGAHVALTIDQNVQHIVEQALDDAMVEQNAKGAWAVVTRVQTGEVLAIASRPAFDPNQFSRSDPDARMNRAIGFTYEPGSTFKAVVACAALNEATVTPSTVFDCENGSWLYAGKPLRDFHPYGRLTFADGIKKSSNIMAAKVALGLGNQRFFRYLKAFGVGAKTRVDLPGEELGILHEVDQWSGISPTRIAIGQGVSVTALQMVCLYAAIANDGFLMRPWIVKEVRAADGTVLMQGGPEAVRRPIRADTAATMRELLARVTEEGGTGTRAAVEGYRVAGKTGTAQKPDPIRGGYSSTAHVGSFVGFIPAEHPQIALVVVIDEPQPCHTGGVVAAPVFARIASQAVRYLEISPGHRGPVGERSRTEVARR
jgi:cell division protein FtsI (penicillin-binding protein 3)